MAGSQQRLSNSQSSYGSIGHSFTGDENSFDGLAGEVGKQIFKVNSNASVLERQAKKIATKDDGPQLRDKLHVMQLETNAVVTDVKDMIQRLQRTVDRGDKPKKLQIERLKTSFRSAVDRYSKIQESVKDKAKTESLRIRTQSFEQEPDTWSDEAELLAQAQRREQLQQQQFQIEDEVDMAREREERIRVLESEVLDVNQIFRDLGTMVVEQGDMVDDIEANVVTAHGNVEEGNVQLDKAVSYQKSYRKKLCILIVILILVGGVVALILGLSLHPKK